ncbi:unnamed protein product [Dracunculus medinensis]|uniref:Sec23/Sec24 trunk domain-containing protein n=1 Tax=Dracunculus medinensis TaxID=318479 RepID=A0A3P7SDR7_DRAME|nr:unnamed protein product [Dracunculus medinensis]
MDHTGRRTDICNRPEQFLGSYEFVATTHYCKNGAMPKEPAFIFMLDVSYSAVQSGLVSIFCRNIRSLLNSLPRESGQEKSSIRVGFATYDQAVHFYNLKNVAEQPEMLVVSDVNDVFVPFVDVDGYSLNFCNFSERLSLLTEIEKMFAETRCTETILGPVIQAGLDALKIILQPGTDFYSKLAEECVKNGCAVDLFLFPNSYIDVASLAPICVITGGTMYKYHYFEGPKDGSRFLADLAHDISRDIAFDAMMRVRTSTGLRATNFCGSFYMDNSTDMEMGVIDSDKAVHVELRHDDKLPDGSAYIQTAILFTTCSGQRRLRIHNIALAVSSEYSHLYRLADPDCLVSFLLKQAEFLVREKTPQEMRDAITHRCAQMLATYREKCNEQVPVGQLILPESLKLLPLFGNCIIKNDAVSGGNDMTVDDRSWMMQMICSLRIEDALLLLYPSVSMPAYIRASFDNFSHDKAYIIYNGIIMFLWIGLQVPQTWIQDIFNSNSVSHLNVENHIIPERDNTSSRGLRRIIDRINSGRARYMKLFIIRQQDALEAWMKKFLVEDRSSAMPSYVDFLCNIHREIRTLLS